MRIQLAMDIRRIRPLSSIEASQVERETILELFMAALVLLFVIETVFAAYVSRTYRRYLKEEMEREKEEQSDRRA